MRKLPPQQALLDIPSPHDFDRRSCRISELFTSPKIRRGMKIDFSVDHRDYFFSNYYRLRAFRTV